MSLKDDVRRAAHTQVSHVLGFGLNSFMGFCFLWWLGEIAICFGMLAVLGYIIVEAAGWWFIPIAVVIINLIRFAYAYGKARHGKGNSPT